MTGFRGVLIDFYGTLVHEDDLVIAEICADIHRSARVDGTPSEIARVWWQAFVPLCAGATGSEFLTQRELARRSLRHTIDYFRADLDVEVLVARQYAHWRRPPIFADTRHFLITLKGAGMPVCIVSNIDRDELTEALALHGMAFEYMVTSEDVGAYKPHPAMFDAALDLLGLQPTEVLHIGDSFSNDVVGAARLGIPVAWLNRVHKPLPQPGLANYIIDSLRQALPVIGGH